MPRLTRRDRRHLPAAALIVLAGAALAGCSSTGGLGGIGETTEHGYVVSPMALEQVPVGSSQDQVLVALGTPSTTGSYEGEAFYYISQRRSRPAQFMNSRVVDQRVLAVYFDRDSKVTRIANYGMQDGQVFDFVSRTTPTGGRDLNFIQQMLTGLGPSRNIFGN